MQKYVPSHERFISQLILYSNSLQVWKNNTTLYLQYITSLLSVGQLYSIRIHVILSLGSVQSTWQTFDSQQSMEIFKYYMFS